MGTRLDKFMAVRNRQVSTRGGYETARNFSIGTATGNRNGIKVMINTTAEVNNSDYFESNSLL